MRRRVAVIVNPASGRGRAAKMAQQAGARLHQAGLEVDVLTTVAPGHAHAYAMRVCQEMDVLVSVGGDGTLNEVVNGVLDAGSETPIAVIPTGTANVVARELGLPEDLAELVEIARTGQTRSLDLGLAGGRRFTMCAGIGLDAQIVALVSRGRGEDGISMLDYTLPTVRSFMEYHYPKLRVRVDGESVDEQATFVVIGNMRRYGGPLQLFREATPDDGRLDVCCLHGDNILDLLRYGWGAFWNRMPELSDVTYHLARDVRIESNDPVLVQVDGDRGGELPMEFSVLPSAVSFCVGHPDPHGESSRR